jgi:hypothetical protein
MRMQIRQKIRPNTLMSATVKVRPNPEYHVELDAEFPSKTGDWEETATDDSIEPASVETREVVHATDVIDAAEVELPGEVVIGGLVEEGLEVVVEEVG